VAPINKGAAKVARLRVSRAVVTRTARIRKRSSASSSRIRARGLAGTLPKNASIATTNGYSTRMGNSLEKEKGKVDKEGRSMRHPTTRIGMRLPASTRSAHKLLLQKVWSNRDLWR
jgi:hypothetical protein